MEKSVIRMSFILPFYGVERYIGKCLDSIYHQDIPEDQYEVICINDCSPDNSEQIVLQYAQEHTNLKLIKHDVNKKLGAARNTGLRAAQGNYVWFIDTDDFYEVREVQKNLLKYYEEDFSKHAPKEVVPRIMMVWNSIPSQLAKENRKFIYGCMREGARAKDFELAIQWLEDAGLIIRCYRITKPDIPLIAYMEMNSFKMFTLDVGLLGAKANIHAKVLLDGCRIFEEFKGALTEQFVAQQLKASDRELYYYSTENSSGEIDFVIQQEMHCVPIEVKAEENLRARSLRAFCDKYKPEIAVRSSMSNYREQDWMINVPLYALDKYLEKKD